MITCHFENNNKASLRHVTVDAIIVKNNKILLVRRSPDSLLEGNKLALPGGFLDRDETTAEAVLREVLEETGYKGKIISLFRVNDNPNRKGEDRQNVDFVFLIEPLEKVSKPDHEIQDIHWFNLDKLPPLILSSRSRCNRDQTENQFAFDHYENVMLYQQHIKKPLNLPIIVRNIL